MPANFHQFTIVVILGFIIVGRVNAVVSASNDSWPDPLMFVCQSGALLDQRRLCDGRRDCHDGSDERRALCARLICPAGAFRCQYGACVSRRLVCDGVLDCADGTDEEACGRRSGSCARNQFRCKRSGHCIDARNVCDGHPDCPLIDFLHDADNDDAYNDAQSPYDPFDMYAASSDEAPALCGAIPSLCPAAAFRCTYGGCVRSEAQCDGHTDCLDASDESPALCLLTDCAECRRAVRCPAIIHATDAHRVEAQCQLASGVPVACDAPLPAGVTAQYSCREFYEPAGARHRHNGETRCQADGTWSRDPLRCRPVCGRRWPDADVAAGVPLVVRGRDVERPFPWHVSVYVRRVNGTTGDGGWRFWCGATLITEAVVITAAHCVWGVQADAMRLVIGSTSSHYFDQSAANNGSDGSADDADRFARTLAVRQIRMHPLYQDRYGNYGSDVALVEIAGRAELGADALPVCIDWHLDDITEHLQHASLGYVMGMGVTEQLAYSDRMRWTALPVVGLELCLRRQRRDFRKYVTGTTFCAGWANGTAVCNGDSGGGLVFESRRAAGGVWYLQGIVSLSPRSPETAQCDPFAYTIFTKVGMYVQWIANHVAEIHERHVYEESVP